MLIWPNQKISQAKIFRMLGSNKNYVTQNIDWKIVIEYTGYNYRVRNMEVEIGRCLT